MTIITHPERPGRALAPVRADSRSRALPTAAAVLGVCVIALLERDIAPDRQVVRALAIAAATAAVALALHRWPVWAAGLTAFGLGIVGAAVGAGIAAPHFAKGAAFASTATGLLALGTGSVLMVGGVALLVRAARRWWRVGVVAAALVVAIPTVFSLAIAVAATNVPPTSVGPRTPGDLGLAYRDVEFAATDGVLLSGWYVPGDNGAGVVLLHGAGSTRSAVLEHAAVLARHGYAVLLFDARGHGRSAGRAMDFGWFGDEDVGGAVSFLTAQAGVQRIAAVGLSMGGEEAIGAAAADDRIDAVVAEGATSRVTGDKAWLPDEHGLRGWLQRPLDWLTYGATDLLTTAEPPITLRAAVAATNAPVLLIAAGDVADEDDAARYVTAGSPNTVRVWEAPDTGHTDALQTHPVEWEARVTAFLAGSLGVPDP